MLPYKYGTYGEIVESKASLGVDSQTIPVYIGTAPVNLVPDHASKGLVNKPVRVRSLSEAQKLLGYFPDFSDFTLNEALAAHFDNGGDAIGPIYAINVLDPEAHRGGSETVKITFSNGKALIRGTHMIVDSLKIPRPLPDDVAKLPAQSMAWRDKGTGKGDKGFDYAKAYKEAGLTLEDGAIKYMPTGVIDPKLINEDGKAYAGILLKKPEGATKVTVKINGEIVDPDVDLQKDGPFVSNGELIEYFWFADENGNPRGNDHFVIECDWVGSETTQTGGMISTDDGANFELGTDYEISYNATRGGIVIQDVTGEMPLDLTVTYDEVDPSQVTAADIIGEVTNNGARSGIEALKLLFMERGVIANLIAAPGWSHIPEVCAALSRACRKINGHWDAMYIVDIPLEDDEGNPIDTMEDAIKWKKEHGSGKQGANAGQPYNDERSKVCWPMALDADGRAFHLSTLCVAEFARIDQENNGVPFETCGNKTVAMVRQYFGATSKNSGFDQRDADEITQKGITTLIPWANTMRLWGDHTGAYDYEADDIDPRTIFDVSMRMLMHITNSFQRQWMAEIDSPMTRDLLDTIINVEQEKLDRLVSIGALIGEPKIVFVPEDNSHEELVNGYFAFSLDATPTPPLKSATVYVAYTDAGFDVYWGEGEE